jgi:hypothetical protein
MYNMALLLYRKIKKKNNTDEFFLLVTFRDIINKKFLN